MKYKIVHIEKKEGIVDLPIDAIPLGIGITRTKPFKDPGSKLVECVKCLVPIEEIRDEANKLGGELC